MVMQQCVLIGNDEVVVICVLLLVGFYDCWVCCFVSVEDLFGVVGVCDVVLLFLNDFVQVLLDLDVLMKGDGVL